MMWVGLLSALCLFIILNTHLGKTAGTSEKALSHFRLWCSRKRQSGVEAASQSPHHFIKFIKLWTARINHDRADSSPPLPPRRQRQRSRVTVPYGRTGRGAEPGQLPAKVRSSAATQEAVRVLRCGHPHPAVHVQRGGLPQDRWVWPHKNLTQVHFMKTSSQKPQIP